MDLIKLFSGGFPMTTETIDFIQDSYNKPIQALTNLTGDAVILEGIINTAGTLSDGYLVKDKEIFPFRSSALGTTVYIHEHTEKAAYNVDANNDGALDLKDAYVTRYASTNSAEAGDVQISSFDFSSLTRLSETRQPIGSAILWFDAVNIPKFYRVMDGTGGTVNGAPAIDLRNMFIKMAGTENDINTRGGSKTRNLAVDNLPAHSHTVPAHSHGGHVVQASGDWRGGGRDSSPNSTSTTGQTASGGGGNTGTGNGTSAPFDIEPRFYSAIWIQYTGF
jgi:hypothetical protein